MNKWQIYQIAESNRIETFCARIGMLYCLPLAVSKIRRTWSRATDVDCDTVRASVANGMPRVVTASSRREKLVHLMLPDSAVTRY